MNWREIEENWKTFVDRFQLEDLSSQRHYFHGKLEVYTAKEAFSGFDIFYENRFNKSADLGASIGIGSSFSIISPISLSKEILIKIKPKAVWKKFFGQKHQLEFKLSDNALKHCLPISYLEELSIAFPDLEISIEKYGRYNHYSITYDSIVLMLSSKYQPKSLQVLEKSREVFTTILQKLEAQGRIKVLNLPY
ncbi:hypothetical protein [Penaeicola halotolerans]|uniref:hypothetical protein n=1 Tax=Penaeicola halotolerans TaxID=2793196 RepID=UPI001CF82BE5|nr:hypothetical protein [Penaeicola halotolerans]